MNLAVEDRHPGRYLANVCSHERTKFRVAGSLDIASLNI
jgi:hypothetical protein